MLSLSLTQFIFDYQLRKGGLLYHEKENYNFLFNFLLGEYMAKFEWGYQQFSFCFSLDESIHPSIYLWKQKLSSIDSHG